MNTIFITGTDTDAGKTMLSLLVMHALHGRDAVYLKPVQTGCSDPDTDSDPAFVHRHLPDGLPTTPAQAIHACRVPPKAPLFAGEPVDFQATVNFVLAHAAWYSWTVVEGAGGVLVPVTSEKTMLDLALETKASILVAGRAGLGTINHTLLTLADCIMLFATPCKNRFPIDTWIKKIMEEKYAMKVESKKDKDKVQKFVEVKFSPYAGIAQQYLFYSAIGD